MSGLKIPKSVKMIVTDFDGVLTDATVFIHEDMSMSKRLHYKDIMAISLLKKAGKEMAIISGDKSAAIDLIASRFNLKEVHQDIRIKVDVLKDILQRNNLSPDEVVYIGDDVNDIECLNHVSTKITVPHAVDSLKVLEGIQITSQQGGEGAFREVVDCLLNY